MRAISSSGKPPPLSETARRTRSPASSVRTSIAGRASRAAARFSSASCAFCTRLWITWRICAASAQTGGSARSEMRLAIGALEFS